MNSPTGFNARNKDSFRENHVSLPSVTLHKSFSQPNFASQQKLPAPKPVVMSTWRINLMNKEPKNLPNINQSQTLVLPSKYLSQYNSQSMSTLPKYESTKITSQQLSTKSPSSKKNFETFNTRFSSQSIQDQSRCRSTHRMPKLHLRKAILATSLPDL